MIYNHDYHSFWKCQIIVDFFKKPKGFQRFWNNKNQWFVDFIFFKYLHHDLIMEIMQKSFIHNSYNLCINIVHWKHIWCMDL